MKGLEKAKKSLERAARELGHAGTGSTDSKKADDYLVTTKRFKSVLPAGVVQAKGLRSVLKIMARSQPYRFHNGRVDNIMGVHRRAIGRIIDLQSELIDVAIQRLRHNAK